MLERAASGRRNREGSLRCSLDDSRRKLSILQAIGDEPVKIADVADCRIGSGTATFSTDKMVGGDKQPRTVRRTSLTTSDSLLSRRSGISGFCPKSQSSSSDLASKFKSNADCENVHDLPRIPKIAGSRQMSNDYFGNYADGRMIDREGSRSRSRRNSQALKFETPDQKGDEYCETKTENQMSGSNFIDEVMTLAKPNKTPKSQSYRGTEDANSDTRSKLKGSIHRADNNDESKNKSDLTGGNSTKDSMTSPSYVKGFELGKPVWRGPLYSASFKSQNKKKEDFLGMKSGIGLSPKFHCLEEPKLVKGKLKEIPTPAKLSAGVKIIGNSDRPEVTSAGEVESSVKDKSGNKKAEKLSLRSNSFEVGSRPEVDVRFPTKAENPNSPLTAEIVRLDADIKQLYFRGFYTLEEALELSCPQDKIYPDLSRIQFNPTGYSPKKLYQSPRSPEDPPESSCSRKPAILKNEDNWNLEKRLTSKSKYETKDIKNQNDPPQDLKKTIQENEEIESKKNSATKNSKAEYSDKFKPNMELIRESSKLYSPKKLYKSPRSPEDPAESSCSRKAAITKNKDNWNLEKRSTSKSKYETKDIKNQNNPPQGLKKTIQAYEEIESKKNSATKNSRAEYGEKFKPNMESTRKSSLTDLSKDTGSPSARESTVSSVTVGPETPESLASPETSSPPEEKNLTLNSTVGYNIDNFLVDALGDELYNTTVTYPPSEGHERSISQFNASELISEEGTPLQSKRKKRLSKKLPDTEPPPQHSSTFNRTMTIYRSLTQRIKNKLRPGLKSVPKAANNDSELNAAGDSVSEDEKIQALRQEANIQQTLMYQATKALICCRSMKEFAASTERVESERSLLVAGLKRAAALEEIRRLELNNNENEQLISERGEVTIKSFSLPLKENILKYEAQTGDFVQWFVIVVSLGATVWATRAVSCPIQSPRIIFNGGLTLSNLSPNFKITVKIYLLKMRRSTFNYDDKYHLNQAEKHSRCPSPKKLIRKKSDRSLSPKEIQQIEFSTVSNPSFVLSGMVELYLHDVSLTTPWPLTSLLPGSVLQGTIDLSLSCKLHLSISHAGFLTHGDEAGGLATWNRRWCVLRGQTLKFWNYPCDQEDKEPLAVIDLTNCISEQINAIDRTLCAKPRTLLIEIARQRSISDRNSMLLECRSSCTVVRNLLCCDTARDFSLWKSKLNHVISALRDWNVTSRPRVVQDTDL